jgi:tRNA pseudouridine55 synthase
MPQGPGATTAAADGLLLIDKPRGVTSHDVITIARRALGINRVGHAGTLDPLATGLLILLVGRSTRLLPYIETEPKEYDVRIAFGAETETDDAEGSVVRRADAPPSKRVMAEIEKLTGHILQVPPAYSAKHHDGRRAYRAARRGRPLDLPAQHVVVLGWTNVAYTDSVLNASVLCGDGTYVRALARDLGRQCGSAAHVAALRRTRVGDFAVNDAVSIEALKRGDARVLSALSGIGALHREILSEEHERMIVHGRRIPAPGSESLAALVSSDGKLVAIAELQAGEWKPRVVMTDA